MTTSVIMVLLGGLGLYFGAEWLVRGAAGLARSFGVRPLVVGLTVVAYGTSAPEFVVSAAAALEGRSSLVLGNVIGSNIANLGVILGVTALISPPRVEGGLLYRELPVLVGAAVGLPLLLLDGEIGRLDAAALALLAVAFTFLLVALSRRKDVRLPEGLEAELPAETGAAPGGRARLAAFAVLGLAVLLVSGKVFVDGASALALVLGMSERLVGLTVVAVGTSLPEMAASLVAALRGHSAIAVGNVVGSNIFNVLLIVGGAGLLAPIAGSVSELRLDFLVMIGLTVVGAVFLRTERRMARWEGALLLAAYAAFITTLVASQ